MFDLQVGVGRISLRLRHSRSLKDKRKVVQSLVQKLRNLGFSVTEAASQNSPKYGCIGFSFTGTTASQVEDRFRQVDKFLLGDFEVLSFEKDIVDYEPSEEPEYDDENILDDKDPDE